MLSHPHNPDTTMTLEGFEKTADEDWWPEGYLISGDYLATFEEYRGFYCRGVHTRTCPWDKEFFVYSELDTFDVGIGYAENLGPGLAHLIDSTEMRRFEYQQILSDSAKKVNWWSDRIDGHQNCVCTLVWEDLTWDPTLSDSMRYGENHRLPPENFSIPPTQKFTKIFTRKIRRQSPPNRNEDLYDQPADTLMMNWVTAHEIGHQVNILWFNYDTTSVMYADPFRWINVPYEYTEDDTIWYNVKEMP